MSRAVVVLRPEPGNRATVDRLGAAGLTAIPMPLFEIRAIDWTPPSPDHYDALLLTSANAVRFGGEGLAAVRALPALAVGAATAEAARRAGFDVRLIGGDGAAALLESIAAQRYRRLLHLGGRDRTIAPSDAVATTIAVYASDARAVDAEDLRRIENAVVLVHSPRAGSRLGDLVRGVDRLGARLAAISRAAAEAAGAGWAACRIAAAPTDAALVELAGRLAD
jgi:uroporphyrinogen-III synthase